MTYLIFGLLAISFSIVIFLKTKKKHSLINSEGIATVHNIIDLGKEGTYKLYAVNYDVEVENGNPIQILVTPCNKEPKDKQRRIFFEKENPKNFYFQTLKNYDSRFNTPIIIFMLGLIMIIYFVIRLF